MDTFDFSPERYVPETIARDATATAITMNGWQFVAKPTTPYQRKFKLTLHGLRWYLDDQSGFYDPNRNPKFNARRLELFYQQHEQWKPFNFVHQHLGFKPILCRFATTLNVPAGQQNSGGLLAPLEVQLIEHNPGY